MVGDGVTPTTPPHLRSPVGTLRLTLSQIPRQESQCDGPFTSVTPTRFLPESTGVPTPTQHLVPADGPRQDSTPVSHPTDVGVYTVSNLHPTGPLPRTGTARTRQGPYPTIPTHYPWTDTDSQYSWPVGLRGLQTKTLSFTRISSRALQTCTSLVTC